MTDFQRGNAFLYILIAVVLFGGLMFSISRSAHNDDPTSQLDDGKAKIAANSILSYAAVASNAIIQMEQSGTDPGDIDFMYPSDTNFNTAPTINKLFHPDGGGLNYKTLPPGAANTSAIVTPAGYYIGRFNNVEWTPTTAQDIIFTAYELTESVCEELNRKIRGSTTIPPTTSGHFRTFLLDEDIYSGTNVDFNVANCTTCEEISSACVSYTSGADTKYAFYSILTAR